MSQFANIPQGLQPLYDNLTLKRLPAIQEETEKLCTLFEKGPTPELYRLLCFRMDQLEDFYLANDSDHRAFLVEKMRLNIEQTLAHCAFDENGEEEEEEEETKLEEIQEIPRPAVVPEIQAGKQIRQREKGSQPKKRTGYKKNNRALYKWEQAPVQSTEKTDRTKAEFSAENQAIDSQENSINVHEKETSSHSRIPAKAAEDVALGCYAAAHSGSEPLFLSPFGSRFFFHEDAELQDQTTSSETLAADPTENKSEVLLKFTVKLTREEYFEVIRRREILNAKRKAQMKANKTPNISDVSVLRHEKKFVDRSTTTEYPCRETRKDRWVCKQDFYVPSK